MNTRGRCNPWKGATTVKGYGKVSTGHNTWALAHRVAWEKAHGPIPDGLQVLHHCDNPPCVALPHLFLGTNQDNVDDQVSKGRQLRGETHNMVKLTEDAVLAIRSRADAGEPQRSLSREFGVSFQQISRIVLRKNWRHV